MINGFGLCECCNYVKEVFGWCVSIDMDEIGCYIVEFIMFIEMYYYCIVLLLFGLLEIDVS